MTCSNDPYWIVHARDFFAIVGIFLLIGVMVKTEHDGINRIDSLRIKNTRRASFGISTLVIINAVVFDFSPVSELLLMVNLVFLLSVNLIALVRRKFPPNSGRQARDLSVRMGRQDLRPANFMERHKQ